MNIKLNKIVKNPRKSVRSCSTLISSPSPAGTKQLYNTIVVPRSSYSTEVWYTHTYKPARAIKSKGSVSVTNKLRSLQHKVATAITGVLRSTAGDMLNIHTYILPINLLFSKLLFRTTLHSCSLPNTHPLHDQICLHSTQRVKRHLSPFHHLLCFANIVSSQVKTILPIRRSPSYATLFSLVILPNKDKALPLTLLTESVAPVCVNSDRSGFEGGIGSSAILYIKDQLVKILKFYLSSEKEHTVYEAKGVGLAIGLHLLNNLNRRLIHSTILGTNSQAVIRALDNQHSHLGQYILDNILQSAKALHRKQDSPINAAE